MPGGNMVGDIMCSMMGGGQQMGGMGYAPPPQMGGWRPPGMQNNFGMGQQPTMNTDSILRLQEQCAQGDGGACIKLQSVLARQQDTMNQWQQDYGKQQQMYQQRTGRPMGARKSW